MVHVWQAERFDFGQALELLENLS
ncbi:hypothetical protein EMIT0P74_120025 [Pseudomonas sp. IT-P74]